MRIKKNTLFGNLPDLLQAEHLVPAGVGQYGPVPAIELMQPTRFFQNIKPRPQVKMISIAQDDLRGDVFGQFPLMHSLYGASRTYRHKYGGKDLAVTGHQLPRPGL
ncbi:hypothetical protein D9M69_619450 [compost metagenome]